ncbi:MAG: hypothetical protein ACLVML_08450 [Candidatus Gastranaerophilaceae bacterium]|jgi:predicted small lipoprotein YifL|nr:hypothetical protein [Christensenellales bacterium]
MKKLVAFLITVAFAFALAACGNPGGDADPTGTPFKATPSPDPKEDQGEKSALKVRMRYAEGTEGMTYYMIYHFIDGKLDSQEEQFEFETAEKAVEWYTSHMETMSDPSRVELQGKLVSIIDKSPALSGTAYDSIRDMASGGEDTIEIMD